MFEEVDQQPFINFFSVPQLVKMVTFLVITSKVAVLKNLYIHVIRP